MGQTIIAWYVLLQISQKTTAVHLNIKCPLIPHRLHILVVVVLCTSTTLVLAFIISKFSVHTSDFPAAEEEPYKTWDADCRPMTLSMLCSIKTIPFSLICRHSPPPCCCPLVAGCFCSIPTSGCTDGGWCIGPEVEVHAVVGSLTGSTNVEVLVLGVAVELVMAPPPRPRS
jgi:hypothetical protein